MNKVNSIALLALALAMSAGGTSAAGATQSIAITNPSFEDPVTGSPGYDEAVVPTGWYNYNNAGTYSVLPGSPPTGGPQPPDGDQAAFVATPYAEPGAAASIFQRLDAAPIAGEEYSLTVDVGRYGQPDNYTNLQNLREFGIEIGYTTDTGSTIDAFENATWFATYIGNGGASDGSDGGVANGTFESFSVTGFAPSSIPAGDVLIIDFFALEGTSGNPDADGKSCSVRRRQAERPSGAFDLGDDASGLRRPRLRRLPPGPRIEGRLRLRIAPERMYGRRRGPNDISVLAKSCDGRSLSRGKAVIWRMSDEPNGQRTEARPLHVRVFLMQN